MRKHYFLTAALAVCATVASAQTLGRTGLLKEGIAKTEMGKNVRQIARIKDAARAEGQRMKTRGYEDMPLITEQPAGTLYTNLSKSFIRFEDAGGYLYDQSLTDVAADIVVADDAVYIRDPFSLATFGDEFNSHYWAKAVKGEGDTLIVKPQPIFEFDTEEVDEEGNPIIETLYTSRMNVSFTYDEEWDMEIASVEVAENQDIKFVWRNDSLIMVDMAETELFGMVFSDNYWGGVAECNTVIAKLGVELVTLPEGLTVEKWQMRYSDDANNENGVLVNVAISGSDVYLGDLPDAFAGSWAKGTIEGDKVVFPSGQYMGIDPEIYSHTFFFGGYLEEVWDEEWWEYVEEVRFTDQVTFAYDAANKTLKSEDNIVVNLGNSGPGLISMVQKPDMRPYVASDKPATPLDPVFTYYAPWTEDWPIGAATFNVSRFDAEGNYLDPAKMYYNIYLDDELMTFYPDEYPLLSEPTTDMSCTYEDYYNIFYRGGNYSINFYASGYEKFGVQLFYTNGGETRSSNIVYYSEDDDTAIGNVATAVESVTYTDLSGRKVSKPANGGIYLKTVKYADGRVNTCKVLIKK